VKTLSLAVGAWTIGKTLRAALASEMGEQLAQSLAIARRCDSSPARGSTEGCPTRPGRR